MLAKISLLITLLLSCAASSAHAQSGRNRATPAPPRNQEKDNSDTLKLRAEEVLLPVSVRSDLGKLPPRLDLSDFIVTEDGKRQYITSVMRTPANVLLILDTSGEVLTYKNINLHRDIALKVIDSLGAEDRAAIITYGDRVSLLSPWTTSKEDLRHALKWKFKPGIRAPFYTSLIYASEEVLPKVSGRRSVVIISDGVESIDATTFEKAFSALHHARATVYVATPIAILLQELKPRAFNALSWYERLDGRARKRIDQMRRYYRQLEAAEVILKGMTEETGGAMWNPLTREQFISSATRIIAEIETEYVIAYSSERPADDTAFHPVKVFPARPGFHVRSRRGIYANLPAEKARGVDP